MLGEEQYNYHEKWAKIRNIWMLGFPTKPLIYTRLQVTIPVHLFAGKKCKLGHSIIADFEEFKSCWGNKDSTKKICDHFSLLEYYCSLTMAKQSWSQVTSNVSRMNWLTHQNSSWNDCSAYMFHRMPSLIDRCPGIIFITFLSPKFVVSESKHCKESFIKTEK